MQLSKNVSKLENYAEFIPHLSNLCAHLNSLLRKNEDSRERKVHEEAVDKIKAMSVSSLLLIHYNQVADIVGRYAANIGIEAILYHHSPDETEKIVVHASISLSATQLRTN
ncbi:hypothetical protein AB6A40_007007 [Gnathostoma spinigerum]|uniref:Uncharacterized protein n=1 Tax=Gnathostoma spinigerum TaxID=75299 RepID=A0ABD6EK86_9BILA